ncbi:MAG: DUF359 domain-containing protein [Candidatus Lokiarchaeota archaeon]|nr:DUF359 domain-containing protein [Candidatus Lokiarchaeota archaeon]
MGIVIYLNSKALHKNKVNITGVKIINENLKIPSNERHKFSQPLGKLYAGTRVETIIEVEKALKEFLKKGFEVSVYLVGDIVTQDFLASEFLKPFIILCIVDEKTQRNRIEIEIEDFFEDIIEFENPEGGIKKESFKLLDGIVKAKKRTLMKITEGEEDLLVLPLVLSITLNENVKNLVFYGQPPVTDSKKTIPEGIVMVDVEKRIQKIVDKFVGMM